MRQIDGSADPTLRQQLLLQRELAQVFKVDPEFVSVLNRAISMEVLLSNTSVEILIDHKAAAFQDVSFAEAELRTLRPYFLDAHIGKAVQTIVELMKSVREPGTLEGVLKEKAAKAAKAEKTSSPEAEDEPDTPTNDEKASDQP
eukprot:Blabericola_migrator_1__12273@NODE_766_length_6600_cov_283_938313_g513_i2_p4_GENE_NODE_766_length_6600_cov_283_938313_g513_i2NODE_766_length_6600_cov_283_938313_g513_i2_p4_ORF_typecomplete_len144_score37_51_NODE_766_length_6600_cov_283_938313_g513_i238954326